MAYVALFISLWLKSALLCACQPAADGRKAIFVQAHPSAVAVTFQVAASSHVLTSAHGARTGLPATGTTNVPGGRFPSANTLQHFPLQEVPAECVYGRRNSAEREELKSKPVLQEKGCSSPWAVHRGDQRRSVATLWAGSWPKPFSGQRWESGWGAGKADCAGNDFLSNPQCIQHHHLRKPTTVKQTRAFHALLPYPIRLFGDPRLVHLLQIEASIPLG